MADAAGAGGARGDQCAGGQSLCEGCALCDKSPALALRQASSTVAGALGRVADAGDGPAGERVCVPSQETSEIMTLLIDTNAVAAPHRVEFWAKSSCDAYHPLHIGTDATDRFWARMWADRLGPIGVYRIAAGPNTMRRTPRDIVRRRPRVSARLSSLLRGRLHGAQQHRASVLGPGDITSYDTSHPAIFRADAPFDLLVIRVPKATLGKHADKVSRLTAVRIPGEAGLPRLAARFCSEAAAGLADGSIGRDDTGLAEHVIDLVRRLYVDLDASRPPRPRSTAELLIHAQAYIEAKLSDPNLNPEELARACFISTRYLHRVFDDRRAQRVRLHPLRAARALSARPDRPGLRGSADLVDREPLGPVQRAPFQPPVPQGVRLLAAPVPGQRGAGGRCRRDARADVGPPARLAGRSTATSRGDSRGDPRARARRADRWLRPGGGTPRP